MHLAVENIGKGNISKHKTSFFAFHSNGLVLPLSVDSSIKFHSKKFGSINLNPKTHSHLAPKPIIINYIIFNDFAATPAHHIFLLCQKCPLSLFFSVSSVLLSLNFLFKMVTLIAKETKVKKRKNGMNKSHQNAFYTIKR